MKTTVKLLMALLVLGMAVPELSAGEKGKKETQLYAVSFFADWCPVCKAIGPSVMQLQADLKGKPVEFVKFDFTNDETKAKTRQLAKDLGLEKILEENNGTGFVILVNPKTGKEEGRLNRSLDEKEMLSKVKALL